MIIDDIRRYRAVVPENRRLIGLDLGTKTIGIALSDVSATIASPFETLQRAKFTADANKLKRLCADHQAAGLVLGLPVNMDGSEGPRAQASREFARRLGDIVALPILLWDERLSTAAVTRTLIEADVSRRRRQQVVDGMAAAYILQGALDALGNVQEPISC